ncbi:unnamed protein product [Adineta steineri]|uniref:DUF2383 domain-containing protein n=1 Tax=Adineta steineri TaxID=433720 RepID=A0A819Z8L5_9BILA|nr:unnamed protein product [Adineta steineri]
MTSNTATSVTSCETSTACRVAADKCQIVLAGLHDSLDGYRQCAADTKDTPMRLLFDKIASSRADLISLLSNSIRVDLGVEPIKSGSPLAAAHRTWIDVKAWFTDGRDKSAIISEVHLGEEALIKLYETAIEDSDIPLKLRDLLHAQVKIIKEQNASVDAI